MADESGEAFQERVFFLVRQMLVGRDPGSGSSATSGSLEEVAIAGMMSILVKWVARWGESGSGSVQEGFRELLASGTRDDPDEEVVREILLHGGMPPPQVLASLDRIAVMARQRHQEPRASAAPAEAHATRIMGLLAAPDGRAALERGELDDEFRPLVQAALQQALCGPSGPPPSRQARQRLAERMELPEYREEHQKIRDSLRQLVGGDASRIPAIRESLRLGRLMTFPHRSEVVEEHDLLREDMDAFLEAMEKGEVPLRGPDEGSSGREIG